MVALFHSEKRGQNDAGSEVDNKRPRLEDMTEEQRKQFEKDEKIRLRREKLAAWQKQREAEGAVAQQQSPAPAPPSESAAPSSVAAASTPSLVTNGAHPSTHLSLGSNKASVSQTNTLFSEDASSPSPSTSAAKPAAKPVSKYNFKKPSVVPKKELSIFAEEEPAKPAAAPSTGMDTTEDEVDPLDAFMEGVVDEVKKINEQDLLQQEQQRKTTRADTLTEDDDTMLDYLEDESAKGLDGEPGTTTTTKQRKELGVVDHSRIHYPEFRKSFYVEVPEIARMTEQEVAQLRFDLEGIKVRGKNCPAPIKTWTQCGVSLRVLETLKKLQYDKPTPIQAQAVPAIMAGRDLLGIAKTGSGKTLAFLLPMFRHINDQPPLMSGEGCIALILSPTRELAVQTNRESMKFAKPLDLRSVCVYGGTNISEQIADMKRGAEIIVCTPGRMIDMLTSNGGRVTNLRRVTYVVLDEADRMFDMGFEPQVMRILDNVRPDRQTVMFSATFPRQMEALARKILSKPIEVQVGGRSVVSDTIKQEVVVLDEDKKFLKLLELLGHYSQEGSVIVFVDKQEKADMLLKDLMVSGYPCLALHGGVSQEDRGSNIADFKNGVVNLLIATSVAARGLDVKSLVLVVNYDCPNHYEDYVHRAGRTGRAGRKGTAFTFITEDEGAYSCEVIRALELAGHTPPAELTQLWEKHKAEMLKKGIHRKQQSGGFGGHGFKFNTEELAKKKEAQILALKAHAEDDEDDIYKARELELQEEIKDQVNKLLGKVPAPERTDEDDEDGGVAAPVPAPASTTAGETPASTAAQAAAEAAKALTASKGLLPIPGSAAGGNAVLTPSTASDDMAQAGAALLVNKPAVHSTKAAEAAARALELKKRLGLASAAAPAQTAATTPSAQWLTHEIEINDFPQQARFKVTRKEYVSEIQDFSGCSITVRGQFYPPNKEPKGEERKLYLFLEGPDEQSINKAKAEIRRILGEELHREATTFQPDRKSVV